MKKIALLFFGAFALTTSAQAAFFDFTAEGNNTEAGYSSFTTGSDDHIGMEAGLTITATGLTGAAAYAYMDGDSGGPGGLGVCPTANCSGSSADNQQAGETIIMSFLEATNILDLVIIGNHTAAADNAVLIWKTDNQSGQFSIGGSNLTLHALTGHGFSEWTNSLEYTIEGGEMYLASLTTVPVPAAIWLFGTALIGFVGMSRRTKVS